MPTEKRYEINELTDTESTADAGNMLNGKAVVDEPTVTEFTEIESMDEIIKLFGVFDENLKIIEAEHRCRFRKDQYQRKAERSGYCAQCS